MKLWRRHPTPAPASQPRANHTRIAVLEHDLLGIKPEPGSAAALVITFRQVGDCFTHDPVDTTTLSDPVPTATCDRCGKHRQIDPANQREVWTEQRTAPCTVPLPDLGTP